MICATSYEPCVISQDAQQIFEKRLSCVDIEVTPPSEILSNRAAYFRSFPILEKSVLSQECASRQIIFSHPQRLLKKKKSKNYTQLLNRFTNTMSFKNMYSFVQLNLLSKIFQYNFRRNYNLTIEKKNKTQTPQDICLHISNSIFQLMPCLCLDMESGITKTAICSMTPVTQCKKHNVMEKWYIHM